MPIESGIADAHAPDEFHVAGLIVYTRDETIERVARALEALPGAEVHARAGGKLVLTLEAAHADEIAERLSAARALPDVLNIALVYQHHERPDSTDEDHANETDAARIH
jgi:periplasmic nitrate reductase NapD